jgi:hypothetical protein
MTDIPSAAPSSPARPAELNVTPKTLALITGGGLLAGVLIVLGAILPAEYNMDPLGLGKLTGLSRLWAPDAKSFAGGAGALAFTSPTAKVTHTVDIPLGPQDWPEAALEYKVNMLPGQSILYRWQALTLDGQPITTPVEYDQHGHDVVEEGQSETVVDFRKGEALSDQGSLAAPMAGIYGWYFRNHSDDPVIIRLEVEGYYTLIPPGEPGNEFRVLPVDPAPAEPAPQ